MNEKEWVKRIRDMLNEYFEASNPTLHADVEVKLPYGIVIDKFDADWNIDHDNESENRFATDLLVYEEKDGKRIPRVVMEAKFKRFTTHDPITYGKKAAMHRAIMPALRYGLMLGAMEDKDLTWRLFEHGDDFDFMLCFKGEEPTEKEKQHFLALVNSEVNNSKNLADMFGSKGAKSGIWYVQKGLTLHATDD